MNCITYDDDSAVIWFIQALVNAKIANQCIINILATGPGNPPGVQVQTTKMVRFSSRAVQQPDPLHLGRPNQDQYLSRHRFCRVWPDQSVRNSGSGFWVFLLLVTFGYPTANCKTLTLVHHCPFMMHWPPLYSKTRETRSLPHPENESQQNVNRFWSWKSGNRSEPWLF